MPRKNGTVLYFTSTARDYSEEDLLRIIDNNHLDLRLCQVAEERDAADALRLLVQRGARVVDGLCVSSTEDGSFQTVGAPMRLYG